MRIQLRNYRLMNRRSLDRRPDSDLPTVGGQRVLKPVVRGYGRGGQDGKLAGPVLLTRPGGLWDPPERSGIVESPPCCDELIGDSPSGFNRHV
jgi:hypothetical protein